MTAARHPLPTLKTMLAICSEARADLQYDINHNPELRGLRWRHDRERLLWALDASGERLNHDGWAWNRTKGMVADMLAQYPQAVEIIVDSGIDVAANREDMEAFNHEPNFWQVVIWRADRAVYSNEELDDLIRTRTAFRSMNDMLKAGGNYRPSLDCSDPVFLAIADRYDHLQACRGDDRRAYRYRFNRAA